MFILVFQLFLALITCSQICRADMLYQDDIDFKV